MDLVDKIMRFENDEMDNPEIIIFFQELVDNGMAWKLQGSYGRTAQKLIDACMIRDTWNYKGLPANATLLEKKPVRNSEHLSIVLCMTEKSSGKEFVTWVYNHEMEGCVSGHYFDKLHDAAKDFEKRN